MIYKEQYALGFDRFLEMRLDLGDLSRLDEMDLYDVMRFFENCDKAIAEAKKRVFDVLK